MGLTTLKKHILTKDEAGMLFSLEEDNLSPLDESYTDEQFSDFVSEVSGKTLGEYAKWRFPDNPKQQLKLAIKVLSF